MRLRRAGKYVKNLQHIVKINLMNSNHIQPQRFAKGIKASYKFRADKLRPSLPLCIMITGY
ncbi:MAG: hypothetical protein H3C25_06010 [Candidatus Brocadia sapporoensis]|nr:hypothetical protein [Candidatus Brocadia sapporoensis]